MKTTPLMTLGALIGTCLMAAAQTPPQAPNRPPRPFGMSAAEILKTFDKDGDGKLSLEELQAMQEARAAKMEERRHEMLAKYDTDGDGKLSDAERAAMPKPHGRPGGKYGAGKPPGTPPGQ